MMDLNKAEIFKAIAKARNANIVAETRAVELQALQLLESSESIRPQQLDNNLVNVFTNRINSDKIAGSIESINTIEDLPLAVAAYISRRNLPMDVALQPRQILVDLNWQKLSVKHHVSSDERIAITMGDCGIAETGSIVIHSAPDSPILMNFLPSHHILVLFEEHIVANLEDYVDNSNSLNNQRTVCLITGASGTTDIEGVLVNGAHGPEHLHVITVKQAT